jgi:hypothetical protein
MPRETSLSNRPNVITFMQTYAQCKSRRGGASESLVHYLKALEEQLTHEEKEYVRALIFG